MAEFKLKKEISIVTRQEQEVQDLEYWSKKSYSEKLDACFFLLQQYLDMHPDDSATDAKGNETCLQGTEQ
jgi:hypothetical protein